MIRKSPYVDENYSTLMSSDLNLVLTNTNITNLAFEENSLNFSNVSMKKVFEEEKSGNFTNMIEEKTPEKNENPLIRKKKEDDNKISIFNKTFNMMIQGSKDNGKLITENTAITNSIKCRVCGIKPMQPPNHFPAEQFIKCPLCKKNICCFCISKCVECNRIFCKVCTVINYDQNFDRTMCLECNK